MSDAVRRWAQYKDNESRNNHAENLVILAEWGGDAESKAMAEANLEFSRRHGYVSHLLERPALEACSGLYAELKRCAGG